MRFLLKTAPLAGLPQKAAVVKNFIRKKNTLYSHTTSMLKFCLSSVQRYPSHTSSSVNRIHFIANDYANDVEAKYAE